MNGSACSFIESGVTLLRFNLQGRNIGPGEVFAMKSVKLALRHCLLMFWVFACLGLLAPGFASAHYRFPVSDDLVEIEIYGDDSGQFPLYSAPSDYAREGGRRWYLPARRGERFTIEVRNRGDSTVGLVISVDGRNIITGERSYLRSQEGMYILPPRRSGRYSGWRSNLREVQRFYFTEAPDSYAGAWGDYSQMGMIAVAAFRERYTPPRYALPLDSREFNAKTAPASSRAGRTSTEYRQEKALRDDSEAGTGYGERHYSPVREVSFEPESLPFQRLTIRYDWPENLRRMGIIPGPRYRVPSPESDRPFAPPPPR